MARELRKKSIAEFFNAIRLVPKVEEGKKMAAGASSVWMLNQSSFLGSCQQLSSVSKLVASSRPGPVPPSLFIVEASTRPRTKREDRTARHSRIRKKVLLLPLSFIFNLSSPLFHCPFMFLVLSHFWFLVLIYQNHVMHFSWGSFV